MPSFFFWQNMAAIHQVEFLRCLAETNEVHWLVDELLAADRIGQGWTLPELGSVHLRSIRPTEVASILDAAPSSAVHVLSPRGCAAGRVLLPQLERRRLRYGFLVEKPMGTGFGLFARGLLYRWISRRSSRLEFMLAMGETGARWYRAHGFPDSSEFAYTVPGSRLPVGSPAGSAYRFICVAQLIPRKRHVDLLRAVAHLEGSWTLDCIGRGPLEERLKTLAASLGIADRVTWTAAVPNDLVRARIAAADSLVLPSSWEGWGAVVNEAVAEGTRVVVSDEAGAACLLAMANVGASFPAKNVPKLGECLRIQMERGRVMPDERRARRALHDRIDGRALAGFFRELMAGENPPPPWRMSA